MDPRSLQMVVVSAVLASVASVATGLRFYARHLVRMAWELDDYLAVVGLVSASSQIKDD